MWGCRLVRATSDEQPTLYPTAFAGAAYCAPMHQRLPTNHRLARLATWAGLWLVWMDAFLAFVCGAHAPLSRQARAIAEDWLDRMSAFALKLIVIRAAKRRPAPRVTHRRASRARMRGGDMRAIIGSRLRRRLRSRDLRHRIDAIAALLRDPETAIAALLRRLARGLTRRTPHHVERNNERVSAQCAPRLACADSS